MSHIFIYTKRKRLEIRRAYHSGIFVVQFIVRREHGQEHIVAAYDKLDDAGKEKLAAQVERIDWSIVDMAKQENSKIYTSFVRPILYLPFGPSDPRRVPCPPASSTAPTLPARIASSPISSYFVLSFSISDTSSADSGSSFPRSCAIFQNFSSRVMLENQAHGGLCN